MPSNPIRDVWNRVRGLGRKVEEGVYDFTEEEEHEEPRGRNTLMVLMNGFFTIWKASQGTIAERTFGMLGFAGLLWLIVGDRGLGVRRSSLRVVAVTFAALWFVPGMIAAAWMVIVNMGVVNLRRIRLWPMMVVFGMGGLISFRAVFADLAAQHPRRIPKRRDKAERR